MAVDLIPLSSRSAISPECFGRAVESVMPSRRRYTWRLAKNDSDDLVQGTLTRAWQAEPHQ